MVDGSAGGAQGATAVAAARTSSVRRPGGGRDAGGHHPVAIRQPLTTITKVWRLSVSELEQSLEREVQHRNHLETERAKVAAGFCRRYE